MGPKGIGPQRLGAGMSSQKSDCCGVPNCGCSGSPAKLAPVLGMIAKKVIVDKVAEKAAPGKRKNCSY